MRIVNSQNQRANVKCQMKVKLLYTPKIQNSDEERMKIPVELNTPCMAYVECPVQLEFKLNCNYCQQQLEPKITPCAVTEFEGKTLYYIYEYFFSSVCIVMSLADCANRIISSFAVKRLYIINTLIDSQSVVSHTYCLARLNLKSMYVQSSKVGNFHMGNNGISTVYEHSNT